MEFLILVLPLAPSEARIAEVVRVADAALFARRGVVFTEAAGEGGEVGVRGVVDDSELDDWGRLDGSCGVGGQSC